MMAALKEPMPIGSYILISEKNIFSPERKDFPITPLEQTKTNVRPQVILYGVTIAGDFQAASLVNPGRPLKKGERKTITVKIGGEIGKYKLAKILPDRIAMENNRDTFEVLLYDPRNRKRRMEGTTETKPDMIAIPQPAQVPASGEAPTSAPSGEPAQKPENRFQAQVDPPIPFNKYTYHLFPPTAEKRGRRIFYPPSGAPAQESAGK